MQSGRLRYRLTVEQPIAEETTNGEPLLIWEPVTEVMGDIYPLRGSERLEPSGVLAETQVRIRIKWRPALAAMTAKWRLRDGDMIYEITRPPANIDMANREIVIYCKGARLVAIINEGGEGLAEGDSAVVGLAATVGLAAGTSTALGAGDTDTAGGAGEVVLTLTVEAP